MAKKFLKYQNNHGKNHKGMLRRKNVADFQSKLCQNPKKNISTI